MKYNEEGKASPLKGRGASENPPNRFEGISYEPEPGEEAVSPQTEFIAETVRSAVTFNNSSDVMVDATLNPYRGCEHGCVYCYARPNHEYLGLSAGLDFETKIFFKENIPERLRRELAGPRWQPQLVGISGVTDPYQPVERRLRLTRSCLEVFRDFRNPVGVITKNRLVIRDIDILAEMAGFQACMVILSMTTLDPELAGKMEPRTSRPAQRLETIAALHQAGIPVGVNLAPIIPGLTDHEIPSLVSESASRGAAFAHFIPLRLPYAVAGMFEQWLEQHYPARKDKVLNRIREIRGGRLNDPEFGSRMTGKGAYAEQMSSLFRVSCKKAGISEQGPRLSTAHFRRDPGQLEFFFGNN